jgi:hypothetical protein
MIGVRRASFADAVRWFAARGRRTLDEFQESNVKRDPKGKFSKSKSAGAPEAEKKPKAKPNAKLYAQVQALGLEKGQPGKYEGASKVKLEALIAGHHGWWTTKKGQLKGNKPKVSPEVAESIKAFLKKHDAHIKSMEKLQAKAAKEKAKSAALEKALEGKPFKGAWTPKKARPQHKKAISLYTDGHYKQINDGLRKHGTISKDDEYAVKYLDEVTANATFKGTIYRGISAANTLKYAEAGLLKPGAVIKDAGFGSFSKRADFAKNWKAGLVIEVEGGKGCADVSSLSQHPGEDEVLMARDMRMRVVSYDEKARRLKVEIMRAPRAEKKGAKNGQEA